MEPSSPRDVSVLLRAWRDGDRGAFDTLVPIVYAELHRLAHWALRREGPGHPLQTTALVHEAYLRLAGGRPIRLESRAHFFAVASQTMRRVLVDVARKRRTAKRGGGVVEVALDSASGARAEHPTDVIALDQALESLAAFDARKARLVELRYFGGLSVEESAEVLQVSVATVKRDWQMAKLWLLRELDLADSSGPRSRT